MKLNVKVIKVNDLSRMSGEAKLQAKRILREALLKAWDIHKSNISYGAENESEEEHARCITWWKALKDLEDWAFVDIPQGVKKYLKE